MAKFFIFANFTGHFGTVSADGSAVAAAIFAKEAAAAKIANYQLQDTSFKLQAESKMIASQKLSVSSQEIHVTGIE